MPIRPQKPCSYPECTGYAVQDTGRCHKHQRQSWRGRRGFEGYKGEYQKVRRQVLREERQCALCGEIAVTVDHIRPVSRGGGHERSNLRALCKTCHDARSRAQAKR